MFFLLSFFIVSGLILSDRNYFLFEDSFKESANKFIIFFKNRLYTNNKLSDDAINARIRFL